MPKGDFSKTEAFKQGQRERNKTRALLRTHCRRGHLWIPENFYYHKDGSKQCKLCTRERGKEYQDSGRRKLQRRKYYSTPEGRAATRKDELNTNYGSGAANYYKQKVIEQDGLCAICKKLPKAGKVLGLDHRHSDGKWRAVLCTGCNIGIGNFKEDTDRLEAAISYLKTWNEKLGDTSWQI